MYSRWQKKKINEALETRRILVLAGPRQCGKTTLVQTLAGPDVIYQTLDDVTLQDAAIADTKAFVSHGDELMVIDEIQRVPQLLQAIKQDVDTNKAPGRFLLTGSANIQSLPSVRESLAGRVRKLRLRPLTQGEIFGRPPFFLQKAFSETFEMHKKSACFNIKDDYLRVSLRGGYPEALTCQTDRNRRQWHKDYLSAIVEKDLKEITNIRRQDAMFKLLEVLAAWSSKFMDISKIGTYLSLSRPALESYINALEILYLVERVRPWPKQDYDRISKQDKIFMTDTGVLSSILKWSLEDIRLDGDKNGKLIETFIFSEISAQIEALEEEYQLYHYRDRDKRKVDFIIENEKGHLLGIEVKAGSAINQKSFRYLRWFQKHMAGKKSFRGIILYTGETALSFGDHMWALPIHSLWEGE